LTVGAGAQVLTTKLVDLRRETDLVPCLGAQAGIPLVCRLATLN